MRENYSYTPCWLCGTTPRDLKIVLDLAERIAYNQRMREGLEGAAEPTRDEGEIRRDDIDECPACGAPDISEATALRLRQELHDFVRKHRDRGASER